MVADTWTAQELPVLSYLVERLEAADLIDVRTEEIADALGMPAADVGRSLRKLAGATPPYIQVYDPPAELRDPDIVYEVTERARRAVDQWPTAETVADRLVAAFAAAAEQELDEEQRSWLQHAAVWLGSAGRDFAVDVGAAVVSRQIGGG
jgi:DNA-binding MarR family transcriptional regulator